MSYYTADEMKKLFEQYPQYIEQLYCKGFLLTSKKYDDLDQYPFYGNWSCEKIDNWGTVYYMYTHKDTYHYVLREEKFTYFLIGHAYNPFTMKYNEMDILKDIASRKKQGSVALWEAESELTGVFCFGYMTKDRIYYSTDCCGMQLTYHGVIENHFYLTSHSKLVADLVGLEQSKYIRKLVNSKYWHFYGTWLPGDLSPFEELKRVQPNFAGRYDEKEKCIRVKRYYPLHKIDMVTSEEEYDNLICDMAKIMSDNMHLVAKKWPDKKVSISVTGGRDSMTTLSCSKDCYDEFYFFSYISNYDESVDADASQKILGNLGLERELYQIPEDYEEYKNIEIFKKIMECNAGCIGHNNENDVKKRMYFLKNPPCDIEVKSWVNEMGRGWYYNKYNKKHFPKYPNASYWRAMHKVYVNPWLIHETDKVFREYLKKYYNKAVFDNLSWMELYFWEFSWSGGEGVFLTTEHRVPYDITIPFNNRKYVELMMKVPTEKRIVDAIPNDIIDYMEPRISEAGIKVKDISHTDKRALLERIYLEIMSKVRI